MAFPLITQEFMNEDRGYPVPNLIWAHRWRCEARLQGMAACGGDICNPGLTIKLLQKVGTKFSDFKNNLMFRNGTWVVAISMIVCGVR